MPSEDSVDHQLVDHVERGEMLDLAGDEPVDEQAMRTWDASRTVSAKVIRDIVRGRLAPDPDPRGLRLRGARITGRLDLAFITSSVLVSLSDCLFEEGLIVIDSTLPQLDLEGSVLAHPTEIPLAAAGLTTTLLTIRNATVTSNNPAAAVLITGADLGDLDCWGATIRNDAGPAIAADDLRVPRKAIMSGGFTATTATGADAVTLNSAEIGELYCINATIRNDNGTALGAENLRVHRLLTLSSGFTATGTGPLGAVNLDGAELGELECMDATLENSDGPALSADNMRVHRNVAFRRCTVTGTGSTSAISLVGTEIGELSCRGNTFHNPTGPVLDATDMHVHRDLDISDGELSGAGESSVLGLANTRIGGDIVLSRLELHHRTTLRRRLYVDGMTYPALPIGVRHDAWLGMLRKATPYYTAQPYQHLAAVHRAAGHDSQARRVLMAQRRDQLDRRALTGRAERGWVRLTGLTLGYGYQPWRALIGLFLVVGAAVTLAVVLGGAGGLASVDDPDVPCSTVERIGVGLDLGTPLISTHVRCDTTATGAGEALTMTGWALRLLAWAFATLFIAGFTSAVRRT